MTTNTVKHTPGAREWQDKAREVTDFVLGQSECCGCDECRGNVERIVTLAVAEAYQQGREDERARCSDIARDEGKKSPGSVLIPAVASIIADRIMIPPAPQEKGRG